MSEQHLQRAQIRAVDQHTASVRLAERENACRTVLIPDPLDWGSLMLMRRTTDLHRQPQPRACIFDGPVASAGGGLAPLITSHSMNASSLKKAGWEYVNTFS
jgi:hypothetical protein